MVASSIPHRWKYDVLVSFRGEDIQKNFMDHMFNDFKYKGSHAYRDDNELPKGEEISPHLYKAIEESRFLIVIFSKNYASSSWCTRELVKILECKLIESPKHEVRIIFYDVKPDMVRKQTRSYAEAFAKHEHSNVRSTGSPTWFCPGSLIIFTGKDKQLLRSHRVDEIHDMDFLDEDQSLELFCSFAFEGKNPSTGFKQVSNKVVKYVQGHPLALKVLGHFLYGKTVGQWVSELDRLKLHPNEKIQSVLRLSYDGLNLHQQNILLDIACLALTDALFDEVLVLSLEKFSQKVHLDANDFAHMKRLQNPENLSRGKSI
ncbi:NB-ARC domains-containing protein [Tanacetum coccineum]